MMLKNVVVLAAMASATALLASACGSPEPDEAGIEGENVLAVEEEVQQFCGGFAAISCPRGQACVDDPADDCDPAAGGADCGGVCVKQHCNDPARDYVSRDPAECAVLFFVCPEGRKPFFDAECGCGCELAP